MRRLELFVPLDEPEEAALGRLARQAGAALDELRVVKRSLDARKGHPIGWHLEIEAGASDEDEPRDVLRARAGLRVVVVGAGPAGTFAALRLVEAGAIVTIVEAGRAVQPRRRDLALLTRGTLDPDSNYCFGEGGAGTFSDGKLYTRTKDRAGVREVLRALVAHGAERSILVDSRPHIGSNRLPKILIEMRERLIARGVEYVWNDPVVGLIGDGVRVRGVTTRAGRELACDAVVLAVGHSARPIYEMLAKHGVALEAKAFAIGARVEHPQPLVDRAQYGAAWEHPRLPAAFYQLTAQVPTSGGERGVYSFCMCPGGWIVDSATEPGRLATNGMSLKRRDSPFANAALVVTVEPRDYAHAGEGALAGIAFQRAIEERAFELGGGGYVAAAQRVGDFLASRPSESALRSSYRPSVRPGDVRSALPRFVGEAIARGLQYWDRRLSGFAGPEGQLVGVETRSSSPVRILRDARSLQSPSHAGLFPSGEGAGYAGGIVSAALDGLRVADALLSG